MAVAATAAVVMMEMIAVVPARIHSRAPARVLGERASKRTAR